MGAEKVHGTRKWGWFGKQRLTPVCGSRCEGPLGADSRYGYGEDGSLVDARDEVRRSGHGCGRELWKERRKEPTGTDRSQLRSGPTTSLIPRRIASRIIEVPVRVISAFRVSPKQVPEGFCGALALILHSRSQHTASHINTLHPLIPALGTVPQTLTASPTKPRSQDRPSRPSPSAS